MPVTATDLVSVIIPNYNRTERLYDAVQSVFNQTHDEVEIVIVDDSDVAIFQEIADKYETTDSVRLLRGNPPADTYVPDAYARHKGAKHADGHYISFLDSDDTWGEGRLAAHLELWGCHPDLGLSWDKWWEQTAGPDKPLERGRDDLHAYDDPSPILSTNGDSMVIDGDFLVSRLWLWSNFIHISAGFTTKKALQLIGGVPTRGYCDWHMWLNLAREYNAGFINRTMTTKAASDDRLFFDTYHRHRSELDTHLTRGMMLHDVPLWKYHGTPEIARGVLRQARTLVGNVLGVTRSYRHR